uniref:Ras-GEF domain-containing protein n=1 Tax=Pipistrellus kuhlii TaxID=59472 RepID=A0A7J7VUW4_PIPKU|nr:hypothetical protein mPipKuh1_008325 [Pipistrellus kuhlii]
MLLTPPGSVPVLPLKTSKEDIIKVVAHGPDYTTYQVRVQVNQADDTVQCLSESSNRVITEGLVSGFNYSNSLNLRKVHQATDTIQGWTQELFKKVLPHQCLGSVWSQRAKPGKEHLVSTVGATVTQFNHVSTCVITTCLGVPQSGGALNQVAKVC